LDVEEQDDNNKLVDDVHESTSLLSDQDKSGANVFFTMEDETDEVDAKEPHKLYISETDLSEKPAVKPDDNIHLRVPWTIGDGDAQNSDSSIKTPGLFYIGKHCRD